MGDACSNSGFENFTKEIADQTGAYAECIEIGNGGSTSLFENFEKQAEAACESIKKNSNFQGEFNVAGLSQGALIARYIVEECDTATVPKKLLSIGGPNMGVQAIPHCQSGLMCKWINWVAQHATDL
jgi:triacylglycerol esterase/lipase EstA (alpha/beta hydrolase family)